MPTTSRALDAEGRALLRGRNVAHVVTRRADGSPRVVVTWIGVRDGIVLLNARTDRLWAQDLRRDPRVVVTVVDLEDPYRYVTIEGRVAQERTDGAPEDYRALAVRYWGERGAQQDLPLGERVAFDVTPERVRRYDAPRPEVLAPPAD